MGGCGWREVCKAWGVMFGNLQRWAVMGALGAALLSGCGNGQAAQCPPAAKAGLEVPLEVSAGLYEVIVEMEGVQATAWWARRAEAPGTLAREGRVMVGVDRWLAVSAAGETLRVTECWRGATPIGGCAELGPPRSGTMVVMRDGAEVLRLALATANVDTVAEAGCPTLHAAKAR